LKKLILLFLLSFLFYACHKKKEPTAPSTYKTIDSLLSRSNDDLIDRRIRLECADQVNALLDHDVNDSITNDYLIKLAGKYYNIRELEKYLALSREVYKKTLESNNYLLNAKSLSYIGDYHYNKFNHDSAYFYYSKTEKAYLKLNSKANIDRLKFYKANILFAKKDFAGCEIAVITILKTIQNKNDTRLIYDCYITLGIALEGLNNTESALDYYNKAAQLLLKLKDDPQYLSLQGQGSNFIGKLYQKKGNHNKAITYFEEGLQYGDLKKLMPFLYANLIKNLGYSKFKIGDPTAITLLHKALVTNDSLQETPGIISCKINLSEYYLVQKDSAKAYIYSTEAKTMAHKNKIFEDELKALELLANIDPKKEQSYYKRYIKLSDSLQNVERATRNKFTRIEFETNEIINQKNTIESEKNAISLQRWLILGFSITGILVLFLLYFTTMQRAKNKALEYEKQQQITNEEIYQLILNQNNNSDEGKRKTKTTIDKNVVQQIVNSLLTYEKELAFLKNYTLEALAIYCNTNTRYLSFVINEIKGCSFVNYVNKLRMEYIIEKLETEKKYMEYTIKYLSEVSGYNSVDPFVRAFVTHTKMNPSEFIKQLRDRKMGG
jgi:AraC-like DNA-binding protein